MVLDRMVVFGMMEFWIPDSNPPDPYGNFVFDLGNNNDKMIKQYILGVAPLPGFQWPADLFTFLVGDSEENLHLPLLLGGGHIQNI